MKKVLVLGGTRFFGVHLVHNLLKRGYKVTIATRGIRKDEFKDQVKRIVFDRTDEKSIWENLEDRYFDIIYDNLAYSSNDIEILLPHVSCNKYIAVSSTAVYDPLINEVKETDFDAGKICYVNKKRDKNNYDEGKRLMEAAVLQKYPHVKSILVRFPYVIGKDDYTNRLFSYVESFVLKIPMYIDNLRETMSFIDSKEAGDFLGYLSTLDDFTGIINGASNGTVSIYQIFNYLSEKMNLDLNEELYLNKSLQAAPYNGTESYKINTDKAKALGYEFSDVNDWIYDLVTDYAKECIKKSV